MTSTTKDSESEIKMVISLVKLSFLFNSEIMVFHRYLYDKYVLIKKKYLRFINFMFIFFKKKSGQEHLNSIKGLTNSK